MGGDGGKGCPGPLWRAAIVGIGAKGGRDEVEVRGRLRSDEGGEGEEKEEGKE